ncbi:MAG TPA: hypothetical protein VH164_07755, partial [Ktedonobacteraceae bacterium]|nr:hypothetical protein [Ktedonobacteraceae bacterium]
QENQVIQLSGLLRIAWAMGRKRKETKVHMLLYTVGPLSYICIVPVSILLGKGTLGFLVVSQ